MSHPLSIIIVHYNQNGTLPRALTSILEQNIPDIDVVLVDDCSKESCAPIVEEYRRKGLKITFIENERNLFPKDSRIKGIEAAQSDVITFLDADDWFFGKRTLAVLLRRMKAENADILHFGIYEVDEENGNISEREFSKPYAKSLYGEALFEYYCRHSLPGHNVCGKLFSARCLKKSIQVAKNIRIGRYCEDLFLYTIIAFHADSYIGMNICAYAYVQHPNNSLHHVKKGLGRIITISQIKKHIVQYIVDNGCKEYIIDQLIRYCNIFIEENFCAYCDHIQSLNDPLTINTLLDELFLLAPPEEYLKSIILNLPIEKLKANKDYNNLLTDNLKKEKYIIETKEKYRTLEKEYRNIVRKYDSTNLKILEIREKYKFSKDKISDIRNAYKSISEKYSNLKNKYEITIESHLNLQEKYRTMPAYIALYNNIKHLYKWISSILKR